MDFKIEDKIDIKELFDNEEELVISYKYKDKIEFQKEEALALFLIKEIIFLNTNWYKETWTDDAKKSTVLCVNCNDVFAWGCADAEEININELEDLYNHFKKDPEYGHLIWCIKKRNMYPQEPVYKMIQNKGIWNLNDLNLKENYDSYLKD